MPLATRPTLSLPMRALVAAALIVMLLVPLTAHAAVYDPLKVIPDETFRGAGSLSVADIQAFLALQAGPLKSLVTTDYVDPETGSAIATDAPAKSAAQIVWDAARRWNINPKVIIATLQKEQSLISVSDGNNAKRLRKAMGCGVYDVDKDGVIENLFPGFGNQVWNGARLLSTYPITRLWYPGKTKLVKVSATGESTTIVPANASTFSLYTYTPYYPQINVWRIYVAYFGDPNTPPRVRPVYAFVSRYNGTYYYTASEAKRYNLIRTSARKWSFQGVSFTCDTSASANSVPLFEMYNWVTGRYLYTTSSKTRSALLGVRPRQWRCTGTSCYVASTTSTSTAPVYKLQNRRTGGVLLTSSALLKRLRTTGPAPTCRYLGVAFRLGSWQPTSTVASAPLP